MNASGWLQLGLYVVVLLLLVKPLGTYMAAVYEGRAGWAQRIGGPLERLIYRGAGVDSTREMGWIEYALLRRGIAARVGPANPPLGLLGRLWVAAIFAGALGLGVELALAGLGATRIASLVRAGAVFGVFGAAYLTLCLLLGVPEAAGAVQRVRRIFRR